MGAFTRIITEAVLAALVLGGYAAIFYGYDRVGSITLAKDSMLRFYAPIRGTGALLELLAAAARRLQAKSAEGAAGKQRAAMCKEVVANGLVVSATAGLVWLVYFSGVGTAWMTRPLGKLVSDDALSIFKTFLKSLGDDMNVIVYTGLVALCLAAAGAALYVAWLAATLPLLACYRCCKNAPTSSEAAAAATAAEKPAPRAAASKPVLEVTRDEVADVAAAVWAEEASKGAGKAEAKKKPEFAPEDTAPVATHGIGQGAKLKSVTGDGAVPIKKAKAGKAQ